ncbi:MAG: dioxygenase [Rhizobiaceae bacterium]|nr:dioxygenase [Rhizobiaceae bacterium]
MNRFPPLFLSHGAPNMGLHPSPVREFMKGLANEFPRPSAIIACSAHFETTGAVIVTDPAPGMIYDFRGFEPELGRFVYPAPGEPGLAERAAGLLEDAGITVGRLAKRGYDHGTWVPLSLAWPDADIPVVQLSIDPQQGPDYHFAIGQALASLADENIAIVGTGNITHNLHVLFGGGKDPALVSSMKQMVDEFLEWFDTKLIEFDTASLLNYRSNAPYAAENHPTDEHLLPIFVAMGAAGNAVKPIKLHESFTFDFLAMDAWAFPQS